ncbi:hypothetical protein [Conexibacter sp. DBS9H8]|uniref:hypothetical protein n=1 Tax=Conexibacter sp. DBS9H8 TaxID=2937801 RepID=UPI00200D5B98|nr:hypothetical protein [Conexibacter sp. DBS9H8]
MTVPITDQGTIDGGFTDRGYLREVLHHGSARACAAAQRTLSQVAAAMHTSY